MHLSQCLNTTTRVLLLKKGILTHYPSIFSWFCVFFFSYVSPAWNDNFVCSHSHFPLLIKGLSTRLVAHTKDWCLQLHRQREMLIQTFITHTFPPRKPPVGPTVCMTSTWSPAWWNSTAQLWSTHHKKSKFFIFPTSKIQNTFCFNWN